MKKSITIQIPSPCHENWDTMTPTQKGKFCQVCTKEVIDFTETSDETIIKKALNNESLCGRFKESQLNRPMKLERKSGFSLAPLAASLLMPFSVLTANPSNENNSKNTKEYVSLNIGSRIKDNPAKAKIITTGRIIDSHGKPVANAQVQVKNSTTKEFSGLRGDFKIVSANDATLLISKEGYISQEIKLERKSTFKKIELQVDEELEVKSMILGKMELSEKNLVEQDSLSQTKIDSTTITITGTVIDEDGFPLPGVNIISKNTSTGTQTDFDGLYTIEVQKGAELEFSYIGFETEVVTLSNINNEINIEMIMSQDILGEVVIVGIVGIRSEEYETVEFLGYSTSEYDPEPTSWRKKAKASYQNEKAYSKIKRARKKAEKQLKKKR